MAKLPNSFKSRNRTTREFREQFAKLPERIQELAREACLLFERDPQHPSLRRHILRDNKKGQHVPESVSISITMQYRAIYAVDGEINIWYWIGTHAEYDRFTGLS